LVVFHPSLSLDLIEVDVMDMWILSAGFQRSNVHFDIYDFFLICFSASSNMIFCLNPEATVVYQFVIFIRFTHFRVEKPEDHCQE
jgi:hypothetical protein